MQSKKQSLKPIFAGIVFVMVTVGAVTALSIAMPDPAPKSDAHHGEGHDSAASHEGAGAHH